MSEPAAIPATPTVSAAVAQPTSSVLQSPPPSASFPVPPAQMVRYKRVVGRLTKIVVENYRAFRGRFELDLPEGCNLLVYGENGAGKSSLYHALKDFLESPERHLKLEDNRHAFNTDPPTIRLDFAAPSPTDAQTVVSKSYEWSTAKNDPRLPEMRSVDKAKGFLDYRSLLRVHLLPKGERHINLFDLLINPLLAQYKNPITGLVFAEEWNRIQKPFAPYVRRPSDLDDRVKTFNAGFERVVKDSVGLASTILAEFDPELAVELKFTGATFSWRPKHLTPPIITLVPSFRRLQPPSYHEFLNEARLSALAAAIYFSGLKQSPVMNFGLLVLDDILIGLDMANRMIVLRIVEKLFRDWQVIILTYHKAWFEVLRTRVRDSKWPNDWKVVTLRARKAMGVEFPIEIAASEGFIAQAHTHLDPPSPFSVDVKAAAVYARTAFEAVMSWYCAEMRLSVVYVESRRELDTNDFLTAIERQLATLRLPADREFARAVIQEVKHARHFVLNPHSHYNPESEDEIAAEIAAGIHAVADFDLILRCVRRSDFAQPEEDLDKASVGDVILGSLTQMKAGQRSAALNSLARAFEQHLDEWFRARNELIPYGSSPTPARMLAFVGARKLLWQGTWLRLKHLKDYLLGDVHVKKIEPSAFEAAAYLLLKLRILFLLQRETSNSTGQ